MKWFTVQEAAEKYNLTERAIRKRVADGKYGEEGTGYRYVSNGKSKGRKMLQIAIEEDPAAESGGNTLEAFLQYSGRQREAAGYKALIVRDYQQSGLSPDEYVTKFNAENPLEDAISKSSLMRWQTRFKNGNVADLVDHRGEHRKGRSSIPQEVWDYFYTLYMTQQERGIKLCYDLTKDKYPNLPSVSTFERRVREIPKADLLYYRKGKKASEDNMPSMIRGRNDIDSNSIWFSDHHLVDVFVKSADGQRAIRPWLTVFSDAKSNKIVSWLVREVNPNATAIKQCLRKGIETHGIPDEICFDNGKDYRSKSFNKDFPLSLTAQLSMGIIYTTPYHGQAKPVERFFKTFEDRFGKRFDTYAGRDAKHRPECMQISNKEILKIAPEFSFFMEAVELYINEYNNEPSRGRDMDGKSPNQVYNENIKQTRTVDNMEALKLLCGNYEERTVNKNGISFLNNSYYHESLLRYQGKRVNICYDSDNIDEIMVFDMEMKAICTAKAKVVTPFRHTTEEDYKRAAKEKKQARESIKRNAPSQNLDVRSLIARNQAMELAGEAAQSAPEPAVNITELIPFARKNAAILQEAKAPTGKHSADETPDVADTLLKYWGQGG